MSTLEDNRSAGWLTDVVKRQGIKNGDNDLVAVVKGSGVKKDRVEGVVVKEDGVKEDGSRKTGHRGQGQRGRNERGRNEDTQWI